jgi:hypothetical protein
MAWGVRWYLVGSIVLGPLGVLAGCSGGFFAQREPWRHEAEVQCLNSGTVTEGDGIVRINSISGPGICGADFPLKISMLGESAPLGFGDDLRPPAPLPYPAPRWPVRPGNGSEPPVSLNPPGAGEDLSQPGSYDFRRPYEATPSAPPTMRAPTYRGSPRDDLSPVPYDRRPLVNAPASMREPPGAASGALGPARGLTGAVTPVAVTPAATLACPIVSELERWIANAVQPAALRWFGSPVAEIKQISSYSCRGMNGNPRAAISEHAFGNALDIASFTLADGRTITVKGGWHGLPEEQGFLRDVQGAACDQFTTVLAPGSNAYHYDHIHVDLMRRASGHRACNPRAVSGEEVAARAGRRYAARRPMSESSVTGSLSPRRLPPPPKRLRSDRNEDHRLSLLPLAEPGNDGDDQDD